VTRRRFVRHAELYGTAEIFEVAERSLSPADLGALALRLSRLDAKWRLGRDQREQLIAALLDSGMPDKDIRRMCCVSQPTVRKARSRAASGERNGQVHPTGPTDDFARQTAAEGRAA
jgi:hypothetical protein